MEIETERLVLKKYENEKNADKVFLYSMLEDPEMMRFIGSGDIKNETDKENFLNWIYNTYNQGNGLGLKIIINKSTGEYIGQAGLVPQVIDGKHEMEIGYWITSTHWNNGYATEIAERLLYDGFYHRKKTKLIALIQPGNSSSISVAVKIGMSLDKAIYLSGEKVFVYAVYSNKLTAFNRL